MSRIYLALISAVPMPQTVVVEKVVEVLVHQTVPAVLRRWRRMLRLCMRFVV